MTKTTASPGCWAYAWHPLPSPHVSLLPFRPCSGKASTVVTRDSSSFVFPECLSGQFYTCAGIWAKPMNAPPLSFFLLFQCLLTLPMRYLPFQQRTQRPDMAYHFATPHLP